MLALRRSFATLLVAALPVASAVPLAGCSAKQRAGVEKTAASILISDEQEAQIGKQVKQELETKEKIQYVTDPVVTEYVTAMASRITQQANKDRSGVKWRINVVKDDKLVNAFATPGGYIYVYTGLLLAATSEDEVAGVLAHEAGHVVGRHSARQMVNAYGLEAVLSLALGKNPNLLGKIAGSIAANGLMLAHGRSEEIEADEYGARYAAGGGWDPKGLIAFFQKLQKGEGETPRVLTFLSTHPPTGDRISNLNKYIRENRLQGKDTKVGDLAQIQAAIRASPAAAPAPTR